MLGRAYMTNIEDALNRVRTQAPIFARAAKIIVDSATERGRLFVHDPTGMITYEAIGRAAGLYMMKPLQPGDLRRSEISSKDVAVFFSSRSYLQDEQAFLRKIRERGVKVLGVFPAAMPTGAKAPVGDYCDLVIDSAVPDNQGTIGVTGFGEKLGPIDVVVNCIILWSLCAEVVGEFLRRGLKPSVYMTIRARGADEYNSQVWERYQRQGF